MKSLFFFITVYKNINNKKKYIIIYKIIKKILIYNISIMENFIDKNVFYLLVLLCVFYYVLVYNKNSIENFDTVAINNLDNLAKQIINTDKSNLVLPFNNIDLKGSVNVSNELKIGNIILKDVNGELVINKPIKCDKANIGQWSIRENKVGILNKLDILMSEQNIKFVDYDTNNYNNSKIYTNDIETSLISTQKDLEIKTPILDVSKNINYSVKLNSKEIIYKTMPATGSLSVTDSYGTEGKKTKTQTVNGSY
jgi:hypothetical protein